MVRFGGGSTRGLKLLVLYTYDDEINYSKRGDDSSKNEYEKCNKLAPL